MGKKTTIELNGKRYDAVTGAVLGKAKGIQASSMNLNKPSAPSHRGRTIDGFIGKKPNAAVAANAALRPKPDHYRKSKKHHADQTLSVHQPQRSSTLMRSMVNKPAVKLKPIPKAQLPAELKSQGVAEFKPKLSVDEVDLSRMKRAKNTTKSSFVHHFDALPVSNPAGQGGNIASNNPAPYQHPVAKVQAVGSPVTEQQDEDIFESAIASATSHQQKAPKIKKRRSPLKKLLNSAAFLCACLVIASCVAYLNLANIELHFASVKAGFHATMPNYKALGFSLQGPVKAMNGTVAMNFQSGDSTFTLTQQSSNWDNQTLLDTTTYQTDMPPKSIQTDGRTIYVSEGSHATWVSGGIRYQLVGNSNLNNQQITSIADSM